MNRRTFLTSAGAGSALLLQATAHGAKPNKSLGDASPGENAVDFLAQSLQNGPEVTHFGYVTHIAGLPNNVLFADQTIQNETTARFTLLATTTLDARHELGNIITTSAPGELNVYFNDAPQGDFNDPASFGQGQLLAVFVIRYHNVLNVQAPNQGVISGEVDLEQTAMREFRIERERLRFGHPGLRARLSLFGQGTRTNPDPVMATFLMGGHISILDS